MTFAQEKLMHLCSCSIRYKYIHGDTYVADAGASDAGDANDLEVGELQSGDE